MKRCVIPIFFSLILGCGGAGVNLDETGKKDGDDATRNSENAIGTVRASFDAMGGLERLRLIGAKASIRATASSGGENFPIEITTGGPDRWRLDYVQGGMSYIYAKGLCRKMAYDISARCTPAEEKWMEPLLLLQGLVFPAFDAANLGAAFRQKGETTIDGKTFEAVELRKRNSNLRFNTLYDRQTKLLARVDFDLPNEPGREKTHWSVEVSDWREAGGVKQPFCRTVKRNGEVIWKETINEFELGIDDTRFDMPPPPTTDHPLTAIIPSRRVAMIEVEGHKVELPAPHTAVGAGPDLNFETTTLPELEAIRIVLKSPINKIAQLKESLKNEAAGKEQAATKEASVILLEQSQNPDDPVLMMLYTPAPPAEEPGQNKSEE